jgi:electron transport complex protein RnfC
MKTVKSSFKFHGGVHPEYHKDLARGKAIESIGLPSTLVISMSQHLGAPAKCLVKPGDRVVKGQRIGEKGGFISANVHSSVCGVVKSVDLKQGAAGGYANAVTIETEDSDETAFMSPLDWKSASKEELLKRVEDAGICGMGGAGFPTSVKLNPPPDKHCEYLILNGAECEPYLTADFRIMLERADRIRVGVEIMRKVLNGPAVRIAIEANKPEAIAAMEKAFADIEGNVEIVVLPVLYPQGSEKHQIYATVKRIVPEGGLPIEVGCVVENVGTVAAVADAVELGKPLIERVTTVTGDGVNEPKNILAPCGTRYEDMIAFVGGAKDNVRKVLSGGPMMGFNVADLAISTTKTTSGITLLTENSVFQYSSHPCINCGTCVRACPMNLNPAAISCAVESDDIAFAENYGVMNCIECGACSFSCPAYRDITQNCRRAKTSIRTRIAREKAAAAAAAEKRS